MKETLFTNWHFMRWLRLAVGIYAAVQAVQLHDSMLGFFGALFLFQAVTNTGCCGMQSCTAPIQKRSSDKIEEVDFEEIKSN
ncbi:MAG: hypothetical protein V4615_17320 [Bacteroidota bacterium]